MNENGMKDSKTLKTNDYHSYTSNNDNLFSWCIGISMGLYIALSAFFMFSEIPEIKNLSLEEEQKRIAKLIPRDNLLMTMDYSNGEELIKQFRWGGKEMMTGESGDGGGGKEGGGGVVPPKRNIGAKGVLGLITGKGRTGKHIGLIDDLLGSGKISRNLDQVLGGLDGVKTAGISTSNLEKRGPSMGGSGGIGSLFSDDSGTGIDKVEKVGLRGLRGQVDIKGPGPISGEGAGRPERTQESISKVVKSHLGALEYCYNSQLKMNPNLSGKIVLCFTIDSMGKISKCEMVSSTLEDKSVVECIIRSVKRWQFGEISDGDTKVVYPFIFFPEA